MSDVAVVIIGKTWCSKSYTLRDYFYRQGLEADWVEASSFDADGLPEGMEYPVVALSDGRLLQNPSLSELAEVVGFTTIPRHHEYDVVIIGAGPAGLSAAIYAGSEGLRALLVDGYTVGGQAGSTSYIENLLGYPKGVSGCDFAADAVAHVQKFGNVDLLCPVKVTGLDTDGYKMLINVFLDNGHAVETRTVIIATGASYRYLDVPGGETFLNQGVYYGASLGEARRYAGKSIVIVGGGNSAGQAAMHFSLYCRKVRIVIRRDSLTESMSDYLIKKIEATPNIEVITHHEVTRVLGDDSVNSVQLRNNVTGKRRKLVAQGVFIFIGAFPNTEWLNLDDIARSRDGYIITGYGDYKHNTEVPGIFAAGDCRFGSTKRVATAAGEGANVISEIHRYLATLKDRWGTYDTAYRR